MSKKVNIYTTDTDIQDADEEALDKYISEKYSARTLIYCEDGKNILLNEYGDTLMSMEYADE